MELVPDKINGKVYSLKTMNLAQQNTTGPAMALVCVPFSL